MESFDPSSGLVYRETTSASVRSMVPKWTSHSRGRRVDPSKHRRPTPGCDTLQSMAFRHCIWNIDNMEPEALQWLGWSYASRVYDYLKSTDTMTFRTWSLFRKAFPEEGSRHSTFHVYDGKSEGLLPSVVDRLVKLDNGILTFLCIRIADMTIDQLVSLNTINTLAVLALEIGRNTQLGENRETLTVQRLRDWGRSVGESGAFKKLRVLLMDGCDPFQTRFVLKCISAFPRLTVVGIFGLADPSPGEPYWGDWRPHPHPDRGNETDADSWEGSSSTTRASDMRRLYDASLAFSQDVSTDIGTYRSLSMHYIQCSMPDTAREIAWFVRELKDESARPVKRVQQDKSRPDGKKRKLRDDKKVGIGSLLESFT